MARFCGKCGQELPSGPGASGSGAVLCEPCRARVEGGSGGGGAPRVRTCPGCGGALNEGAVDRAMGFLRCGWCAAVVDIGSRLARWDPRRVRPKTSLPAHFLVEDRGGTLRISWVSRRGFEAVLAAILGAMFALPLVAWFAAPGSRGQPTIQLFPIAGVAFFIPLVAILLFNRTILEVMPGRIHVRGAPFPFPRRSLPVGGLRQLFCGSRRISRTTTFGPRSTAVKEDHVYSVHALFADDRREILVDNLQSLEEALYVEQAIEDHLDIGDRAVAGEAQA